MKFDFDSYTYRVSAAGRVNLIGEHIDYCGGKVLPMALPMKNTVYVRPNGTGRVNLRWTDLPDEISLDLSRLESYKATKHANYHAGCLHFWQQSGHATAGCDMLLDCTVPFGSGLSSSAAIEVSTIAAMCAVTGESCDYRDIALTAQKAEQVFTGVNCGIMDQYASAFGKKGYAILLDCKAVTHEYVPVALGDCIFIIANSHKPHSLQGSKYNDRRAETETALALLQQKTDIDCLADLTPAQFESVAGVLPPVIYDRAKHVVEECERVRLATNCMQTGDMPGFGQILNESHESMRKLYEVTGKEMDALAYAGQAHPGCLGSRMTGGGFGGCTVSIVRKDAAEDFKKSVAARYTRETGYVPSFYDAEPADGIVIERI